MYLVYTTKNSNHYNRTHPELTLFVALVVALLVT